jgi:hypothetical protein
LEGDAGDAARSAVLGGWRIRDSCQNARSDLPCAGSEFDAEVVVDAAACLAGSVEA